LTWHDLRIDTRDQDISKQTSLVVSLNNISAEDLASANTAVVRALRGREASLGPAIRSIVKAEEGVFLLKTEPRLLCGIGLHQSLGIVTVVELVGGSIVVPALAESQNIVATSERVRVDGYGTEIDIRVVAWSLSAGRAVEVPF